MVEITIGEADRLDWALKKFKKKVGDVSERGLAAHTECSGDRRRLPRTGGSQTQTGSRPSGSRVVYQLTQTRNINGRAEEMPMGNGLR